MDSELEVGIVIGYLAIWPMVSEGDKILSNV